ncbi:YqzL family protein [Paenibacillus mucilaginosus]|uniref:Uncharacterized protein n=3 Tax=Paenibacillus mucilaginosus TaxID=61624 RepID=H6NIE3_9BACL|nr:YqzL family protein [Paenibacillus mucilaginosus]AEI42648.1 hypothetical protein KNP414_04116 [Paenibacillus mucilaginosus KNP414]AFC32254.1 hypothetical protein PM3016_5558 [Paenibacillus mucilaginosus 3016]AFH64556.1 hypothetical protein B2K_28310 [Paenibacillus mucilaginosus K02]MCG7214037.1 YqzL family protein [Paenibacillus mucilaginosus]WDM26037.1 YqzL family protein [Paenibacillus mucilaginosus]
MKDFSWKYFSMTGDVDAYLLYKQSNGENGEEEELEEEPAPESMEWMQ